MELSPFNISDSSFTAVSDGQINVPIEAGSNVLNAARDALNGWDPTGGCVYYWNPATATSKWIWSRQIVKQIGKHYFGK
jgi:N-acetylmuramoyl-L-alanine amidase